MIDVVLVCPFQSEDAAGNELLQLRGILDVGGNVDDAGSRPCVLVSQLEIKFYARFRESYESRERPIERRSVSDLIDTKIG